MGKKTSIAWTDATWNPWHGCRKVSQGCKYCYMYRDKARYGQDPTQVVRSKAATFNAPLTWERQAVKTGKPRRVFTCSWSDFFIEEADPWRDEAFAIIARTPHLIYQILTKRPERMWEYLSERSPLPNVWCGVSIENQSSANDRIPILLHVPATIRFISYEPALGPVSLTRIQDDEVGAHWNSLATRMIHWVIAGGESGPQARACQLGWIGNIVHQCLSHQVPVFVKQLGSSAWDGDMRYFTQDRKGDNPDEWPAAMRLQMFPSQ